MDLFTVAAKLKLDSGEFEKNLRKMDREGKSFADSLKNTFDKVKNLAVAVGSAFAVKKIAEGLWNVANAAAQAGDKIDKQSQALGMSRKAYQEWDYILGQSGASIDSMGVSMKTLNSALLESSDETKAALSKLRLSSTELKHMSQEGAFKKVVEAFQKLPAGAQKSALAVQLFGRNGQELLPLLNSSTESIDELRQKANELGLVMNDEDVDASVAFGDALDTLQRRFTAIKNKIGAKFLPALTDGITKFTGVTLRLQRAFQENDFASLWDWFKNAFNIKWPTWDDVQDAASKAWDKIKEGVSNLGGLIFGRDENGEVKWPTWEDVEDAAKVAWDKIKKAAASLGTEFGKLVFGTNEKGEVNWPKLEDLKDFAKNKIWEPLKLFVSNVFNLGGKLIFGTDKTNGEVKWPKLEDLQNAAKDLWGKLKTFVANAFNLGGKLIFGEKTNGEVNYPTWGKIGTAINTAWGKIVEEAGKLTGFVLGNIGDASTVIASIEEKWKNLKETVTTNAIDFISGLLGTDSETAASILKTLVDSLEAIGAAITTYSLVTALPTVINTIVGLFSSGITAVNPVAIAIGAIAAAGVLIYKNWDGIQKFFEDLWSAVSTAVSTAWDNVQNWWTKDILGPVQQKWNEVSSFITGIWEGITGAIQTAIDKINEFFGLQDSGSGQSTTGRGTIDQNQVIRQLAGKSEKEQDAWLLQNGMYYNTATRQFEWTPRAIGDWNIPYDNYPAMLHRNEMVLNATQARQYREGKGNGAGIDFDAMVSRIVAAVTEGIENANIDLDGEKITRNVNRRLAANVRAKRFA